MTSDSSRVGRGAVDRARVPPPGPLRPFHFPDIQRVLLPNGLPVLFAPSPGFSVVTLGVLLRAGGVHEAPERAGLATLTGSLLESGAGDRDAAQVADDLEQLGVQLGVGASWDASHVDVTGLRSRLPAAIEILARLVREPTFPEPEVERLRQEQLASILQRRAEPRGLANEMAARHIFAVASPFHRPLGGTPATVGGLARADVLAFHERRYTPQEACVVVAGDLSVEEAEALAARAFGDWNGPLPPPAAVVAEPRQRERRVVIVDRPGSVQSEIRIGQVGVAHDTPDYFPLLVMNSILGGAFSSRLNMNLRERRGFTYGVSSSFVMRREPGPFLVSTAVQTEVTAPALAEIFRELDGIRQAAVTPRELDDARNYLAGTFPLPLQTTEGVASRLAELFVYDLPLDYFQGYRERILEVDPDAVLRVAREHLRPDEMVVVVVGDAGQIREPLEQLQLGPVVVTQVEDDQ